MGVFANKYERIQELNNGQYSKVYLVNNTETKTNAVIKQIKIQSLKPEELKKIKMETKNLSLINYCHIIKYYDIIEDDKKNNKYYSIVMEYFENGDLRNFIDVHKRDNKPININLIYLIILDICLGIKELHLNNITHEDINPEKIFIGNNYKIKIGGPGISKYLLKNPSTGASINNYTSPELIKGIEKNKKTDIWSLGCLIYELCSLNKCFESNNFFDLAKKISESPYDKNKLNNCNKELKDLIELCLEKDDNKRPDINQIYKIILKVISKFEIPKTYIKIDDINSKILNRNEITIIIEIKKEDINENIYFIDNTESHETFKELNESNTDLYINGKKFEFQKYYKFPKEGTYNIILKIKKMLTDCSYMFYGCDNIINIDLSNFETHIVTNMTEMFCGCNNLLNLDLTSLNTSNVTNMKNMFFLCDGLTNIDVTSFDTNNVVDMSGMFFWCTNLVNLNLSYFNTNKVTNMSGMFFGCKNLTNLNLSNFDTDKVEDMRAMFYKCENLISLNLTSFGKNVKDMSEMFYFCKSLTKIYALYFKPSKFTDKTNMFAGCDNLIDKIV